MDNLLGTQSVDWSLINIWCCGQFFSRVDLPAHTELCHAAAASSSEENRCGAGTWRRTKRTSRFGPHAGGSFLPALSQNVSPVKHVEYWSKKRKDNAKVINEETNETYNNSNLRSSKTLNEFTSSSKDTSDLKDTFVHTNDVKGDTEIETIGDDMPNISDEDAHLKLKKLYMHSCAQCDYKSKLKGNLRNHQMGMHSAVWHKCDQCDYKSRWIVSLKRHVEVAHKELSYPCQKCDYKGTSRRTLKLHLAQHEGVTYNCDQCVKKYKYKWNLEAHKVSAHVCGGEKRFSCDQCDYKAKWKRNVKEHKEFVHEGITYSCDQCDYKAKNKFLLKRHLEIVHKGLSQVGK